MWRRGSEILEVVCAKNACAGQRDCCFAQAFEFHDEGVPWRLAQAPAGDEAFAGEPAGIVGGEERGYRRDVIQPVPMRPSGASAFQALLKSEPMKPAVCEPSVSTIPGLSEFTRILRGQLAREHPGDRVYRALRAGVDRTGGGVMAVTAEPMLMMLPPSSRCFAASCVVSSRPSTLTLKILVECSSP